jgi:hypothetical protein
MRTIRSAASVTLCLLLVALHTGCIVQSARQPAETVVADEVFLDDLQARTFGFFWEQTNPANGMVPDRWPTESFASIAAIGFGLTAYGVGAERGYITREQAAERTLATLRFLWNAPQGEAPAGTAGYRGFFYHFLNMDDGLRFDRNELSTIDTALLMAGVLFAQTYFDRDSPSEAQIRDLADRLFRRVDWRWAQPNAPAITHGWHPETGFIEWDYRGYNETMLLYILALGSPTFSAEPDAWDEFVSRYEWGEFHGQEHLGFAPLFGHQYSHVWIDYRGIYDSYMRERGIDYFENSRRATLAQQAYAMDNPRGFRGYGQWVWGLTASDGPRDTTVVVDGREIRFHTYWARGASHTGIYDDGTIAPTAAGGSLPFAPEITIPTLRHMRDTFGDRLWGQYGFLDSFNLTYPQEGGWFNRDYLGIDQGPILLMAENHRSGFVWDVMRRNQYIRTGLERAGFTGGWLEEGAR